MSSSPARKTVVWTSRVASWVAQYPAVGATNSWFPEDSQTSETNLRKKGKTDKFKQGVKSEAPEDLIANTFEGKKVKPELQWM